MTALDSRNWLRSADGLTPATAICRDDDRLVLSLSMSPEAFNKLRKLAEGPGKSWDEVISKAFALYAEAADANRSVWKRNALSIGR